MTGTRADMFPAVALDVKDPERDGFRLEKECQWRRGNEAGACGFNEPHCIPAEILAFRWGNKRNATRVSLPAFVIRPVFGKIPDPS